MSAAGYNRLWILLQTEKWDEAGKAATALAEMPNAPPGLQMLRGIAQARLEQPQCWPRRAVEARGCRSCGVGWGI